MERIGARSDRLRDGRRFVLSATLIASLFGLVLVGVPRWTVTRAGAATPGERAAVVAVRELAPPVAPGVAVESEAEAASRTPIAPAAFLGFDAPRTQRTPSGDVLLRPSKRSLARDGLDDGGSAPPPPKVVTMLHAMCMTPEWNCDAVRDAIPGGYVLACPTGNRTCGDIPDWGGEPEDRARHVSAAVDEALASLDIPKDRGGSDILMGFSRGAFVARDVAYASPGRYRALVLIGGAMMPDPKRLRASGIEKVVLASGDLDGAAKTMRSAQSMLVASGMKARFVSLGKVYHTLPSDTSARLTEALAWAAEP